MRSWTNSISLLLVVITVVGATILAPVSSIRADHRGPHLPGDLGPVQRRALERGYWTYCFDAVAQNYPGFRAALAEVTQYAAQMTGIPAVEVSRGADCDVLNIMGLPDTEFASVCDRCAGFTMSWAWPTIPVYYRTALLYSGPGWRSTIAHEGGGGNSGHSSWLQEQYNDRDFLCTARSWTIMDCGSGVWQVTSWDRDRIWEAFVPDNPAWAWLSVEGGQVVIGWSASRQDGGDFHLHQVAFNSNARLVVFGFEPAWAPGQILWAGDICGPAWGYCFANYASGEYRFGLPFWQGCFWLAAQNPLTWGSWPMSGAPFWRFVGCTAP